MIIYEIPVLFIIFIVLGLLGFNLAPIFVFIAVIGIIFSIIFGIFEWLDEEEFPVMSTIMLVFHIVLLILFAGKEFRLWSCIGWFFGF